MHGDMATHQLEVVLLDVGPDLGGGARPQLLGNGVDVRPMASQRGGMGQHRVCHATPRLPRVHARAGSGAVRQSNPFTLGQSQTPEPSG